MSYFHNSYILFTSTKTSLTNTQKTANIIFVIVA